MVATTPDYMQIIADGAKQGSKPAVAAAKSDGERRAAPRVQTGANDYVTFNGVRFPLKNWSVSGLLFGPMGNPPVLGETLVLNVTVRCGDDRLRFDAKCEVARVANSLVAVRYECKSAEAAARIKAYFSQGT